MGANGFIGTEIYSYLKRVNLDVIPVTRSGNALSTVKEICITEFFDRLKQPSDKSIIVVNTVGKAHVRAKPEANNVETFMEANINFCEVLGNKIKASNVKKLIHISSISARSNFKVIQNTLEGCGCDSLNRDAYSISKQMGEAELQKALQNSCTSLIILRPVLVYGKNAPGNFGSLVRVLKTKLPLPIKSFQNVKSVLSGQNLASFVHNCIEHETFDGRCVAVADYNNYTVFRLISNLYTALGLNNHCFYLPEFLLKNILMIIGKKNIFDKLSENLHIDMDEIVNEYGWTPYETQENAFQRIFKDRELNE